ncbi:hypothetical protein Barb4_00306 [Bacteroidales bacterium Barb4]|nr:hypothetical protein Barb4_00306 [Bacteroidales bacterium Barb4]
MRNSSKAINPLLPTLQPILLDNGLKGCLSHRYFLPHYCGMYPSIYRNGNVEGWSYEYVINALVGEADGVVVV